MSGEVDRFVTGQRATLRLSAVITAGEEPGGVVFDISHLPPGASARQVEDRVASRVNRHLADDDELGARINVALHDVENLSAGDKTTIRCRVAKGADPDVVKERLRDIWGVTIDVMAELPARLPELLRSWLRQHGVGDGTAAALT